MSEPFLLNDISNTLGDQIVSSHSNLGDDTIVVNKENILSVMATLKNEFRFDMLVDLSAVDHLGRQVPRFEMVYHLNSIERNLRLRVKTPVDEGQQVPSLTALWPIANWLEREVWDMFGIRFEGHPDLKRILMYEEFEGHPLRKDYPINKRQPRVPARK